VLITLFLFLAFEKPFLEPKFWRVEREAKIGQEIFFMSFTLSGEWLLLADSVEKVGLPKLPHH